MRKIQKDENDDMFVITKNQKKKSTKKETKKPGKLKRLDEEYQPEQEKVSSESELQPSSDDDKYNKKKPHQSKSITVKKDKPKSKQKLKQFEQVEEEDNNNNYEPVEQPLAKDAEEFFKTAELLLPSFVQPEFIRDAEGRRPYDPNYDPSTLDIPIAQYQKLSPMFRQYWNAKKAHYDSLVFFRCGRWINVMYNDAIIIARMFNRHLGFWGRDRPCLTVYDSQLPIYQRTLLEKGHKIMLVEQLEKADVANKEDGEIVKREITQLISRGTLQDLNDMDSYESRNLLVLVCSNAPVNLKGHKYVYGVSIVDCTTNNFYLDQFFDDEQSNQLRSIIYKTKPLEVILSKATPEIEKMMKTICNPIIITSKKEFKECEYIFEQLKVEYLEMRKTQDKKNKQSINSSFEGIILPSDKIEPENQIETNINQGLYKDQADDIIIEQSNINGDYVLSDEYPSLFVELEKQYYFEKKLAQDEDESTYYSYYFTLQSFYIQLCYMRQLLIHTSVYRRGKFQFLDSNFNQKLNLYLDSQALESLEIFDVNLQTKVSSKGSLFEYLNKCVTPFGKRLLIKWVQSPLLNHKHIRERQDCVRDLMDFIEPCDEFQRRIKSIPDLERNIIRCFNTIHSHKLKAVPISGGESFGKIKLKEITQVIKHIKAASETLKVFENYLNKFKSNKLKKILSYKENASILNSALKELEKCISIQDGEPQPLKGVSLEYDRAFDKMTDIIDSLEQELKKWQNKFKCPQISYHHGKIRYQIEIPDKFLESGQKPKELVITSKKKGFQRFQTDFIEQQIFNLKVVEDELSQKLIPFINDYFTKFYSYRKEFLQLISTLSEADCLISLALVSKQYQFNTFPQILEYSPDEDEDQEFILQEAYHPCLLQNRDINWVPNTIKFINSVDTLLLTGPNMSGKSTLLRLIGIQIILAQIGCAVPAKSFKLVPFDRIFCRLGASDRMLEGKSTFFIELEETKTILEHCTSRSLVIIDELGRGTSTYDGVALASAVLRYLSQKIKPKTVFATHYHILLDEFALCKNIQQSVMKHYQEMDRVIFEYKLISGVAEKSFATNVAKIAGIPNEVIQNAKKMEEKITKEESKINRNREILKKFNQIIQQIL
ncbi:unnamed protein product [Paramecium pentaurelia]|uniref:DNA mismatch repair protein n=1 Tax=Paramecium pentaurelia TaxID=43138 RepID=A0A8S1UZQ2_9CILI|nr:unnamed protein product [Paramecium pentaurelia]